MEASYVNHSARCLDSKTNTTLSLFFINSECNVTECKRTEKQLTIFCLTHDGKEGCTGCYGSPDEIKKQNTLAWCVCIWRKSYIKPCLVSCPPTLPFLISRATWPLLVRGNLKNPGLVAQMTMKPIFFLFSASVCNFLICFYDPCSLVSQFRCLRYLLALLRN